MGRRHADPVSSAIKIYPRGAAQDTRRTCLRVLREKHALLWMAKLPHPFIVGFRFSCVDRHRLFLGMEQAGGGDLYTLIQTHGPQPHAELMCYTGELCLAVGHMHALDLMHRDLKPENVLLGLDGHIKLCDFSAAKRMPGRDGETPPPPGESSLCGTPEYMAPETLLGHPVCETCDWWSFGCIAVECLTELSIFNSDGGADVQSVVRKILHSPITLPEHAHIGEVESDFLHKLLRRKPEERLGHRGPNGDYEAVLAHPWFDGVTAEALLRKQIQPSWVPAGDFGQAWPAVEDSLVANHARGTADLVDDLENPDVTLIRRSNDPFAEWGREVVLVDDYPAQAPTVVDIVEVGAPAACAVTATPEATSPTRIPAGTCADTTAPPEHQIAGAASSSAPAAACAAQGGSAVSATPETSPDMGVLPNVGAAASSNNGGDAATSSQGGGGSPNAFARLPSADSLQAFDSLAVSSCRQP